MTRYLIQIKLFGYAQIEADSWEKAKEQAEEMNSKDFDMSNDCDIDVLDEMDDDDGDEE